MVVIALQHGSGLGEERPSMMKSKHTETSENAEEQSGRLLSTSTVHDARENNNIIITNVILRFLLLRFLILFFLLVNLIYL